MEEIKNHPWMTKETNISHSDIKGEFERRFAELQEQISQFEQQSASHYGTAQPSFATNGVSNYQASHRTGSGDNRESQEQLAESF